MLLNTFRVLRKPAEEVNMKFPPFSNFLTHKRSWKFHFVSLKPSNQFTTNKFQFQFDGSLIFPTRNVNEFVPKLIKWFCSSFVSHRVDFFLEYGSSFQRSLTSHVSMKLTNMSFCLSSKSINYRIAKVSQKEVVSTLKLNLN